MTDSTIPPRRLLQFSLRTLLVAMLVVAFFLGGRESGRRSLEAERKRADAEQERADAVMRGVQISMAEARLLVLAQEIAQGQRKLQRAKQELSRSQQEVKRLERALRQLEQEPAAPEFLPTSRLRSTSPADVDRLKRRAVPINEYWQRRERPTRFRDAPQVRAGQEGNVQAWDYGLEVGNGLRGAALDLATSSWNFGFVASNSSINESSSLGSNA